MTRREFEENVTTWWELLDWCSEEDCYICNEIYEDGVYNDTINEDLQNRSQDDDWRDIYSWLDSLPSGYNYYRYSEGYGEWIGLTDADFESVKDEALEWGDDHDAWEEDEEEDAEEAPAGPDPEPAEQPEELPMDLDGFMAEASDILLTFRRRTAEEKAAEARAADAAYGDFMAGVA